MDANSLNLDPWTASSLLQKAIRRGDEYFALTAARAFHRQRGSAIWRRLLIIAYEDVGIGAPGIVAGTTLFCCSPGERRAIGPDREVIDRIVTDLTHAAKDRSTDYLICAAMQDPAFEQFREMAGMMTMNARIDAALDPTLPVVLRAAAVWYASGVNGRGPQVLSNGALPLLLNAFEASGLSRFHLAMVEQATLRLREPFTVLIALLLALLREADQPPGVVMPTLPSAMVHRGVPLYTFDKHTSLGKRAIARFARDCLPVREVLSEHVPEFRARDVAAMAAFYADAIPLHRRLMWQRSEELEDLGRAADMRKIGTPTEGIAPISKVVMENLPTLNAIRAQMLGEASNPVLYGRGA